MRRLLDSLERIVSSLRATGASWAVVGGLAVSVRTEPRTTRDVDLAVSVGSDAEAETLIRSLMAAGYEVGAGVEQIETGRLATMRMWPPGDRRRVAMIDLLFASSRIEPEIVAAAEPLDVVPGTIAPIATVGHLIAMKVLSRDDRRRPLDRVDLGALLRVAGPADLAAAQTALDLVRSRGFARGRDLAAGLAAAVRELGDA